MSIMKIQNINNRYRIIRPNLVTPKTLNLSYNSVWSNTILYVPKTPSISFPPDSPSYAGWYDSPFAFAFGMYPYLFMLWNVCVTFPGIDQDIPLKIKKKIHNCPVNFSCKKRWFTVSVLSPQSKHLGHKVIPSSSSYPEPFHSVGLVVVFQVLYTHFPLSLFHSYLFPFN